MASSSDVARADSWELDSATVAMDLASCPISHVTVFNDRAEVTRRVNFTPPSKGEVRIICTGLTEKVDTDSLRVNRGAGRCTILEVSFDVHTQVESPSAQQVDADAEKQRSYRVEMEQLEKQVTAKQSEKKRLQESRSLVEAFLKNMVKQDKDASTSVSVEQFGQALTFFKDNTADVDTNIAKVDGDLAGLNIRLSAAKANCARLGQNPHQTTTTSRDVTVQVDAHETEEVELHLVYMVSGASWEPSYDIRVATPDDSPASMSLSYFGLVKQASNEDWIGCNLSLSTAIPSKGGMPQNPRPKVIRYGTTGTPHRPINLRARHLSSNMVLGAPRHIAERRMAPQMAPQMAQQMMAPQMLSQEDAEGGSDSEGTACGAPEVSSAAVKDAGVGNATFDIERKVQIKSGNKPHKVNIAAVELQPIFQYFATPEQDERVYLQVRAKNNSSYKLLFSEKVSVFFNGSFVTNTRLLDTSPGEEINTFLGHDGSVKCEYRKIKASHTESSGFMSSKTKSTTNESLITVTNTKSTAVSVKVVGIMPRSEVEQIEVQMTKPAPRDLVQPDAASGDNATMQNPVTNNIVWVRKLEGGQKLQLPHLYTVTWPQDKSITVVDKDS